MNRQEVARNCYINEVKEDLIGIACNTNGEDKYILVEGINEKARRRGPIGRPRRRTLNNIKMISGWGTCAGLVWPKIRDSGRRL
jgi:hypothetical protein